ncbi:MAG TPA: LuxR family transcriptional regulator, partial [Mycobacterium sp.]|nr:LuxR family transcriptional regulator [Mycobacterium sp.]
GLTDDDAGQLLRAGSFGGVDDAVLGRIVAEAQGNPRAILEAVDGVTPSDFAGGYGIAGLARPIPGGLTERVQGLCPDERRVLLLAAADPTGDPALQWQAATVLGIDRRVVRTLEDKGWLRLGARVLFVDPAHRPALYRLASSEERDAVHRALAAATDPIAAPDRRTWHLACATAGPDDDLAAELERYAVDAQSRCGRTGKAAFLERSALLTLDPRLRSVRALAAAAAMFDVGSTATSVRLLAIAALGRLDGRGRRSLGRQQARVAVVSKRNGQAAEQMLRAAEELHQADDPLAGEGFLEALVAAIYAGRLGPGVAVFANKVPTDWTTDGIAQRLLVGLAARFSEGFTAAHRILMPSLRAAVRVDSEDNGRRWLWLAAWIAADLWDDDLWAELTSKALVSRVVD